MNRFSKTVSVVAVATFAVAASGCRKKAASEPKAVTKAPAPRAVPEIPARPVHHGVTDAPGIGAVQADYRAPFDDIRPKYLVYPQAFIPAQCWTKTQDEDGSLHNPCYACHGLPKRPNFVYDAEFQVAYAFRATSEENPWTNSFVDRTAQVQSISDQAIDAYVRVSNYRKGDRLLLAEVLADPPVEWEAGKPNRRWAGYVPDAWFEFDEEGFDVGPDGGPSGWRAFAYYPFVGTFWPTNGSTDDVLIRLPEVFRQTAEGKYSRRIYALNLAILDAMIQERDIPIPPTEEKPLGVDLDKDGKLSTATRITYDWAPKEKRFMHWVGKAHAHEQGEAKLAAGLYPKGTEFLHSVRYLDVAGDGSIRLSARMKELRYAKKTSWQTYADLRRTADAEVREAMAYPDRLRDAVGNVEIGIYSGWGWRYQGFIEDAKGRLRPQTHEENLSCVGCHGGISQTVDSSFSYPRRRGPKGELLGWYHWDDRSPKGLPEPALPNGEPEYRTYLEQVKGGDELRANDEVITQFFDEDGKLKERELEKLAADITHLIWPTAERARTLNKAYRSIVKAQSFVRGRAATVKPTDEVHRRIGDEAPTGIREPLITRRPGT